MIYLRTTSKKLDPYQDLVHVYHIEGLIVVIIVLALLLKQICCIILPDHYISITQTDFKRLEAFMK